MTDTQTIVAARRKPSILWTDGKTAAVLHPSSNRKTAAPFSVAFYRAQHNPDDITTIGAGCIGCPLNGAGCYVQNFPEAATHKRRAGALANYPHLPRRLWGPVFGEMFVRIGSYGDPTTAPVRLIRALTVTASSWTGYTHRWREDDAQEYRHYLMASCETRDDAQHAERLGWRWFRTVHAGTSRSHRKDRRPALKALRAELAASGATSAVICPHFATGGRTTCSTCPTQCRGAQSSYDVIIPTHGIRAAAVPTVNLTVLQ